MTEKELNKIKKSIEDLLLDINIESKIEVKVETVNEIEEIHVQIESPEAATLIGYHGETLQALQLIISFTIHNSLGKWTRVLVNIGDYRQKREEQLKKLAINLAMKAKFSGEQQVIPNLSPSERRIVHLALSDRQDVYTESEGEGRQRQLTIKPK